MKTYELLTVFKPNLDAEEVDKLIEKLNSTIVDFGGKVESTDKIGRKKLAYDIQNFRDGFFATLILNLPSDKVAEFNRQLRLNDNILRIMFMEVSKKSAAKARRKRYLMSLAKQLLQELCTVRRKNVLLKITSEFQLL